VSTSQATQPTILTRINTNVVTEDNIGIARKLLRVWLAS
jgi:hypothetical protein